MKLVSKLALAVALAAPSFTFAQDAVVVTPAATPAPVREGYNTGALTFTGGVDLATAYYFRGYLQENSGFIIQPYAGIATDIVEADDFSIGLSINTWNSIHSTHGEGAEFPAGDSGPDAWFESDVWVSLPISFGNFVVTPTYQLYMYPGGAADTIQEASVTVAYDDADLWKDKVDNFKLAPYVTVAYELQDGNGSEDGYLEVGIKPGYSINAGDQKIQLTVPVSLGMSFDDYYTKENGDNDWLGYVQIGLEGSLPLDSFIPSKYGSFALVGGAYYQNLFSDSLETANHDSSNVFWGKIGISFSY